MVDRHVTHLVTRYVHGQLRPAQRARVVNHVRTCDICRAALTRAELLDSDLRRQMPAFGPAAARPLSDVWVGVWADINTPKRSRRASAGMLLLPGVSVVLVVAVTLAIMLPILAGSGVRAEAALLQPRPVSPTPGATETNEAGVYALAGALQPQATVAYAFDVGLTPAPVPQATVSPEAWPGSDARR